jgi:hypothetical protein
VANKKVVANKIVANKKVVVTQTLPNFLFVFVRASGSRPEFYLRFFRSRCLVVAFASVGGDC